MIIRIAIIDNSVLSLDKAFFLQALAERDDKVLERRGWCAAEKADHRHRALLRARRKRPRGCRAAEQRDELAPFHLTKLRPLALSSAEQNSTSASIEQETPAAAGFRPAYDRFGSFASLRRAARLRRMSAMTSMATEFCANEPTRMGWTGRGPAPNRSKATWAREEVQVEIAEQINLSSIKVG